MDPNETLRLLRLTIVQMRVDEHPDIRQAHADEIAEYVDALDGWLSGGGFLPGAWQARATGTPAELAALVTAPAGTLYGPTTGARTCVHCGVLIQWNGDSWEDMRYAPGARLVFCTDQDETHDGIRHAPNGGGIAAPVPSEPDRCGATDTNGPQLIVPTTWYCNLPAGHDGAHAARRGNALPNGERVTLHSWPA